MYDMLCVQDGGRINDDRAPKNRVRKAGGRGYAVMEKSQIKSGNMNEISSESGNCQ